MRHITPARLDELSPLFERLRRLDGLAEKRSGGFSIKSRAFSTSTRTPRGSSRTCGSTARSSGRMRVSDPAEQDALVAAIEAALAS